MSKQEAGLGELGSASATLLRCMYDPDRALFPFSSRRGRGVEHTFDNPQTIRYTINTLLGIRRPAPPRATGWSPLLQGSGWMVDPFLELHLDQISNPADLGLLLLLLAEGGRDAVAEPGRRPGSPRRRKQVRRGLHDPGARLDAVGLERRRASRRPQGRGGCPHGVFGLVDGRFVDPESLLARHNLSRQRSRVVSFGGTVSSSAPVYEYGIFSGTPRPARLFESGVRAILSSRDPAESGPG